MNIKTKIATEVALKIIDQVTSSDKWEGFIDSNIDWKAVEKTLPPIDIEKLLEEFSIDDKELDRMIKEFEAEFNKSIEMLLQTETRS